MASIGAGFLYPQRSVGKLTSRNGLNLVGATSTNVLPDGPHCSTCPHQPLGQRFIPPDGTGSARILIVGDSGWKDEVRVGRPFVGASGWLLDDLLVKAGLSRSEVLIANTIFCSPPRLGWMDNPGRFQDAAEAIEHCRPNLDRLIETRQPKVIVPLGAVALRRICGINGIEENAAYVLPTPYGIPAVPSYHPAYLLRGKQKLSSAVLFALHRAKEIASGTFKPSTFELLLDPPVWRIEDYLKGWDGHTLFVDIETPESAKMDEEELEECGPSFTIVRAGFSVRRGTAVTFPWTEEYRPVMRRALERAYEVVEWADNRFDTRRLAADLKVEIKRPVSAMWAWHWLQSDLRKGLAYVAPFYYAGPPFKHLSSAEPQFYSAMDNAVGMECYLGIRSELEAQLA